MKLQEATEIGQHKVNQNVFQVDPDALNALKLLIEAGKGILAWRNIEDNVDLMHLPSETED